MRPSFLYIIFFWSTSGNKKIENYCKTHQAFHACSKMTTVSDLFRQISKLNFALLKLFAAVFTFSHPKCPCLPIISSYKSNKWRQTGHLFKLSETLRKLSGGLVKSKAWHPTSPIGAKGKRKDLSLEGIDGHIKVLRITKYVK